MTALGSGTGLDVPGWRAPGESFDSREFRNTLGLFATGVTVVTASARQPHGMTANAFSSVSKEPPLVMVCVDRDAVMHQRLVDAGSFAVSVLAAGQEPLARYFANRLRPTGPAQFAPVEWVPGQQTGAPLLRGALAWLECGLQDVFLAGDHSIFVGTVLDLSCSSQRDALLFYGGRFRQLDSD
jgi:flavin reductase (DIM6/NTAB) family NADH-FMN oxidoreductase RutF